jgi:arylformamidase
MRSDEKLSKYVLLSYMITKNTPAYGNNPTVDVQPYQSISSGSVCNTSIIKIHNHLGTHVDAPKHFWDEGQNIGDYDVNELIFISPLVIDIPKSPKEMINLEDLIHFKKKLKKCDILLLKTGFWKYRDEEIYRLENPGISPEVADFIRSDFINIRCVGIDSLSVSSYANRELGRKTHKILLQKKGFKGEPMLIIEDMNLSNDEIMKLKTVIVAPLMIENIDGSPCMIIGEIE